MKARLAGFGILLAVILTAVGYSAYRKGTEVRTVSGFVGGEKIGLLEDEDVRKILRKKYHLQIDYAKAGSLDMVRADKTGRNFLFPSSQTALELYELEYGKPAKSDIIFNTPIVLYTHRAVADALKKAGIAAEQNGVHYVDMKRLTGCIEEGKSWRELGLPELYGNVAVGTTEPTKSNSGNMFFGLIANTLAGGVANRKNLGEILPRIEEIYERLGYMETSSADIFEQFLKMGMGAKPIIAGYENQLLEFSAENSAVWEKVKGDIVILYPDPTVWSSHIYIALDESGKAGLEALLDPEIQHIAWEKHGFRTGLSGAGTDVGVFAVEGVSDEISRVMPMPDASTMERILEAFAEAN